AHQATPACRRGRSQDRREDGLSAGDLHLPGNLDRDDRTLGDQVHTGPRTDDEEMTTMTLDAPHSLAEVGISADQIEQLLVKTLYGGEATGLDLSDRLRLPYAVLEALIERVRAERLVEVR